MVRVKKEAIILVPESIKSSSKKLEVMGVFNPAAFRMPNGNIMLYIRVSEKLIKSEDKESCYSPRMVGEKNFRIKVDKFKKKDIEHSSEVEMIFKNGTKRLKYISYFLRVLLDKTGLKVKSIDKKPSFYGLHWDGELGVEDARITKLGDLYVMTYVTLSINESVSTSYAISNDGINWYRRGIIFRQQNKDAVLFPERIKGDYVAFNRPEGSFEFSPPHLWISYSHDLESWERDKSILLSKPGQWDSGRVGAGPPPIKTEKGWLLIYHGVIEHKLKQEGEEESKKVAYSVGAALFDLENPSRIIAKARNPIIVPHKKYEREKFQGKEIIFPTGLVIDFNNKDILLFLGVADRIITVKKISIDDILKSMKRIRNYR
jgi:predicted GH43/DUF377 family glycosyl hydrolase